MDAKDPNQRPRPLAMARGNSPWGEGGGEPDKDKAKPAEVAAPVDELEPKNPWLGQEEDPRPRRSASIEDILRQRPGGTGRLKANWIILLLASLFAVWIAATSVHALERDEQALVLTLGRYSGTIGPGVNLTLPWPLQSVIRGKVGTDTLTVLPEKDGETLMPTRDGELIDISFRVRWRITDLKTFTFNLPEGEAAIRRLADAQVRAAVAELPFKATYDGDLRGQLQLRAAQRVQRVLDAWGAGVQVVSIELVRVAPPARLAETFQKIEKAREEARRNRENDEAWRQQELGNARREAAEFESVYAQYQVAPAITRSRIYYETMERILRANPVIVGGTMPQNAPPPTRKAEGQ
jgi:membrane protease subunit HflK